MNSRYKLAEQVPVKNAKSVLFSVCCSEDIIKHSVVCIQNNDLYEKGVPKPNGLYDLRMEPLTSIRSVKRATGTL